jgi:serine/threonine-protein kinase
MPSPGDRLADRYVIGALLGTGGMATVHRAHDERLDRDVAIKTLLANRSADPTLVARFEREARAMAAVGDPGLVAVFDVEPGDPATGRDPFVVMELCPGGSLADRLGVDRPMPPDELVPILVAVANALDAVHRAGLVHRDVKPSNILFAADRVKLADFGLARGTSGADAADLTETGTGFGTLAYLSPERLHGEPGGPPSDVFALAVVTYLGLTGSLPRPAGSIGELVAASSFRPPAVSVASRSVGRAFDEVVFAGLAVDPGRRPDALAFGTALVTALGQWRRSPDRAAWAAAAATVAPPIETATARPNPSAVTSGTGAAAIPLDPTASFDLTTAYEPAPTIEPAAVATTPVEPRTAHPAGRRRRIPAWLPLIALLAVLGVGFVAGRSLFGGGGPSGPALPTVSSSSSAGPSASAGASALPSASPTARPTASPTGDPARARLTDVLAAISAARGGPDGLKGKQANELDSMASRVSQDLDVGDRAKALRDARDLDRKIRDVSKDIDETAATRLRNSSAALVRSLGG